MCALNLEIQNTYQGEVVNIFWDLGVSHVRHTATGQPQHAHEGFHPL